MKNKHLLTEDAEKDLESFGELPEELPKSWNSNQQRQAVHWRFIEQLQELQQTEGIRLGNKLRRAHVEYYRQIMKVRLAAQTFSSSVSQSIDIARRLDLKDFQGSEGTSEFIEDVNQAFDLLNSHSNTSKGPKASLCKDTFGEQRQKMLSLSSRFMSLRLPARRLVAQDGRRMSIISLAFTLKSVADLAKRLFEGDKCRYIGTYRLSQDHLELFFSGVRQRGGWNNNPSAAQFRYAYRSLLVNADVQVPATANVTPDMEGISTLRHQGTTRTTEEDAEPGSSNPLELVIPDHDYGTVLTSES
ncbi:uncharacterized protein ISCGN_007646 [Ixodes scapularis]